MTITLEQLNEELKRLETANDTIGRIYSKLKENDKKEEREFQLQVFKAQTLIDFVNSFFPLIIATGYSLWVALFAITLTDISVSLRIFLQISSFVFLSAAIISTIKLVHFNYRSMPRKIQQIQDGINQKAETIK